MNQKGQRKTMPRKKRETHLWFTQGDDVIEVESVDAKLNALIRKLAANVPGSVCVYSNENDCLRCSVRRSNLTFRTIRPPSSESKQAQSENGKKYSGNLRHKSERT